MKMSWFGFLKFWQRGASQSRQLSRDADQLTFRQILNASDNDVRSAKRLLAEIMGKVSRDGIYPEFFAQFDGFLNVFKVMSDQSCFSMHRLRDRVSGNKRIKKNVLALTNQLQYTCGNISGTKHVRNAATYEAINAAREGDVEKVISNLRRLGSSCNSAQSAISALKKVIQSLG